MVYRDYWALSQWHAHYARLIGAEHLYIIAHGDDPEINRICTGSNVITIPRDDLSSFDRKRGEFMNGLQSGFSQIYDWVIRTDADELICVDPALHDGLAGLFGTCSQHAVFALGLDLVEMDGDTKLPPDAPVFAHRKTAVFTGHYSKAFAVCDGTRLVRHGVGLRRAMVDAYPHQIPRGVYLVHLKMANKVALEAANAHRTDVATSGEVGAPGKRWRDAHESDLRVFERISGLPDMPWNDAERTAYDAVSSDPIRDKKAAYIRSRSLKFDFATTLPDWFHS